MSIGERIKQRRIELGLTQTELAYRLGNKSRASVCTVEKNKEDLTTDRIRKYAEALETTPSYLMGWETPTVRPMDLTDIEYELISKFRKADDGIKNSILILLNIEKRDDITLRA